MSSPQNMSCKWIRRIIHLKDITQAQKNDYDRHIGGTYCSRNSELKIVNQIHAIITYICIDKSVGSA